MTKRSLTIALAAAAALALAHSAVFPIGEPSAFDSDQASFGLMAKHIAEGRAFPIFIYGDRYMLAVQAWFAAPLFAVLPFGATDHRLVDFGVRSLLPVGASGLPPFWPRRADPVQPESPAPQTTRGGYR